MDESILFESSYFPSPDGHESVESWSKSIFNAMVNKYDYEQRGAEIGPVLKQELETFARAYAMAEMDDHPVLRPPILRAATRAETDGLSDGSIDVNAKRLKDRFREQGWIAGDPTLAPQSSPIHEDEFILIRSDLWNGPEESIREESIISRTEIERMADGALKGLYNSEDEYNSTDVEIVTTTIETRLRKQDWTKLGSSDASGRLWTNPLDIFERLALHERKSSLTHEEIEEAAVGFLEELDIDLPSEAVFDLEPVVSTFSVQLRERGWERVQCPDVVDSDLHIVLEWYEKSEDLTERLESLDSHYRDWFENPEHDAPSEEIEKRRRETHAFYDGNKRQLADKGFFESVGELEGRVELFEFHVEAAGTWRSLDEAEIGTRKWDPGENDWRVEADEFSPRSH